jgi:hypothetical protein
MGFLLSSGYLPPAPPVGPVVACCPSCGSSLVQPLGWKELPGGDVLINLRCPECLVVTTESFGARELAELDESLVESRKSIMADYDLVLRHNMSELLGCFARALELDLIGPDDFRPRPAAAYA